VRAPCVKPGTRKQEPGTRNQEPGTWNMEHSTFRNIPEHQIIMIITRKICKIKFSKTEKAGNAETT